MGERAENFVVNFDGILDELIALPVVPPAREAAANLIEAWIRKNHESDSALRIAAVELGFSIWLDESTLIVGVQDMIAEDNEGLFGNEWKTTTEPTRYWNEDKWMEDITTGPQLAVYALAQQRGTFYEKGGSTFKLEIPRPRIRVRAAVKSNPPKFWPSVGKGMSSFSPEKLDTVASGLLAKAESIRALRKSAYLPWQLTGKQCRNFGKVCPYFSMCHAGEHPNTPAVTIFDPSDPAYEQAIKHIDPALLDNPELVILSASAYSTASECLEKYRIISGTLGSKSRDLALDIGTAFHAGIANYYRQLRDRDKSTMLTKESSVTS